MTRSKFGALIVTAALLATTLFAAGLGGAEDDNWYFTHLSPRPTGNTLYSVAWKPMGAYAAISGQRGTLMACNGTTFYSFNSSITSDARGIGWKPDASLALVAGNAGALALFDGTSAVGLTSGVNTDLRAVAWAPNGSLALIVGNAGTALRYNANGTIDPLVSGVAADLMAVAWAPNGSQALVVGRVAGGSATILWYNGTGFAPVTNTINQDLRGVSFASNGTALIVGSQGTVRLFDGTQFLTVLSNLGQNLHSAAWAPNGTEALVCGDGGTVLRYSAGAVGAVTSGTGNALYSVAWDLFGSFALVVGANGIVLKYAQGAITRVSTGAETVEDLYDVDWLPNGTYALIVGDAGTVLKYDGYAFTTVASTVQSNLRAVDFNPNGSMAMIVGVRTGGGPGGTWTILRYDSNTSTITRITGPGGGAEDLWDVDWAPNGSLAAMVGNGNNVLRTDGFTVTNCNCGIGNDFRGVAWKPDGTGLLIVGTRAPEIVAAVPGAPWIFTAVATNTYPNLNRVAWLNNTYGLISGAVSGFMGTLLRYDISQGPPSVGVLTSNAPNQLWGIGWKPSSNYTLVAGYANGMTFQGTTVKFDLTTCSNLLPPTGDNLVGVAWNPDSSYALLAGFNGRVLKWGPAGFNFSNRPPTVAITSPAPAAEVFGVVNITGTAADPDAPPLDLRAVGAWIDNGFPLAVTGLAAWNLSWDTRLVPDGDHTISAIALDSWANSSIVRVTVRVNNSGHLNYPPLVNITTPVANSTVSGIVNITGSAWDLDIGDSISLVTVRIGAGNWTNATGTSSWSLPWNTSTVPDGNITLRALAYDASNLLVSNETAINVTVQNAVPADQPPVVTITFPPEGSLVSGTVNILGTANDPDAGDTITTVFVKIDAAGAWLNASGTTGWSHSWNTSAVANGNHTIYARALNSRLNFSAEVTTNVTVSNADLPPLVAITSPTEGQRVLGDVTLLGTARDQDPGGIISSVFVRIDNGNWLTATGTTSWTYLWNTVAVANGAHRIYAMSFDGAFNSSAAMVNVIVDNPKPQPPVAIIDSIAPNPATQGNAVSFAGHGTTTGSIVVYEWTSSIDGALSTAPSFNTTSLSLGTHTIRFRVQDNTGQWSAEVNATLLVNPSSPGARTFTINAGGDKTCYAGDTLSFLGTASVSQGRLVKYAWDFGDGSNWTATSNSEARHAFPKKGTYTVKFQVWDELGGSATSQLVVTVKDRPSAPVATKDTGGVTSALAAIGVLVVLIALAAVYFLWSAKRKGENKGG